jgi:hypothetical protein
MRRSFLTLARVIVVLNILLTIFLIIATTTYPSITLSREMRGSPPVKIAASTTPLINTTAPPHIPATAQTNETLDKHAESILVGDTLTSYYEAEAYLLQTLALMLGLILGVTSIALFSEFKASRGRGYLEGAFQKFKVARTWYIVGLISASIILMYTMFIHVLNYRLYGSAIYLLLVFEFSILIFFTWRIMYIRKLQNELLRIMMFK